MQVIGFANKYYTLWDVTEHFESDGNCRYVWYSNVFIKNISMDKETAFAKYPSIEFNPELRGHSSFNTERKQVWENVDTFRYGKYRGDKIADCSDTSYIAWYFNNGNEKEHSDFVLSVLESRGYEYRTTTYTSYDGYPRISGYLMSPEAIEEERIAREKIDECVKILERHETCPVFMETNLDDCGDVRFGDIIYHFNDFVVRQYNGYPYGMPAINGKGKRVKGKLITVTDYTWTRNNNVLTINVEKWTL